MGTASLPQVDVAEVQTQDVVLWSSFTGRIAAPENVELRSRVNGYVERIAFVEGELVNEGDLLFQIDGRAYQARAQLARAELERAQSHLQLAESEAERADNLWQRRAISREEFEQRKSAVTAARASVNAATANLKSAQLELEYTRITAPISGRIGRIEVTRGNLATANTTVLATLVSVDPLHVYFESDQATTNINSLGGGTKVPVRIRTENASPDFVEGYLNFVDNQFDSGTGTLQYRALLPNSDDRFKPGQFAHVDMPVDTLDETILLDQKAILTDQDRRYVYVLEEDNKVSRRYVEVGHSQGALTVIRGGLQHGDRVVVNGLQKIAFPGMQVAPQLVEMRVAQTSPAFAVNTTN